MRFSSQGKIGRDKKNTYPKPKQPTNGSFLIDDGESHMTLRYKVESGFCKIFFSVRPSQDRIKKEQQNVLER